MYSVSPVTHHDRDNTTQDNHLDPQTTHQYSSCRSHAANGRALNPQSDKTTRIPTSINICHTRSPLLTFELILLFRDQTSDDAALSTPGAAHKYTFKAPIHDSPGCQALDMLKKRHQTMVQPFAKPRTTCSSKSDITKREHTLHTHTKRRRIHRGTPLRPLWLGNPRTEVGLGRARCCVLLPKVIHRSTCVQIQTATTDGRHILRQRRQRPNDQRSSQEMRLSKGSVHPVGGQSASRNTHHQHEER